MLKGTPASESEHQITHVLSEFLNESYKVAQKYLAEHEDYKKGKILIPSYECYKKWRSSFKPLPTLSDLNPSNSSQALPCITGKSISKTVSDIKPKTIDKRSEYLTAAPFGGDIKSLETADSDSITTASTQLVKHQSNLQQKADLSLNSVLQGCVEYAESVRACKKKVGLGDYWDYERDCVKMYSVYIDDNSQEIEYRQSYDRARLDEVLSFNYAAILVLHVRDTEKKKLETAQNFKSTITTVVIPGQTSEKTDYEYSKKYPHILSPNHLHWLCEQLIYTTQNADGGGWEGYKIRNKNEKLEKLRAQVTLILTTNIKDYWSLNDLIALLGSVPDLFDEHISRNTIKDNYTKRDNSILQIKGTSNFSDFFLNDDKTLERTKNFLNNLSPYFTPEYMVTKLCNDKEAAKQLFSALFLSEDEFKKNYNYKNNSIDKWRIAKGSTFLNYDDLVFICTSHLSQDSIEDDFFNQIYKNLTGNDKREFFKKGKISSDEIEKAFTALSCNRDADFKTVKLAYRKLAKEHHPDKGGDEQTFKLINNAYKILDKHFSQEEELINSSAPAKDSSYSSGSMKSDTSSANQDEVRSDKLSNYGLPPSLKLEGASKSNRFVSAIEASGNNLVFPRETEQLVAPSDSDIKPVSKENNSALSSNQVGESSTANSIRINTNENPINQKLTIEEDSDEREITRDLKNNDIVQDEVKDEVKDPITDNIDNVSSSETTKRICYLSFDFDGCLYTHNQTDKGIKSFNMISGENSGFEYPTSTLAERHDHLPENYIMDRNQELIKFAKETNQNGAIQTVILCGSRRQSDYQDYEDNLRNKSGSVFPVLQMIASKVDGQFDPFLLSDITYNFNEGKTLELINIRKKNALTSNEMTQGQALIKGIETAEEKISLLYAQIHYAAQKNPEKEIDFHFFDDRTDLLIGIKKVFEKHPKLLPKNVTLHLHQHTQNQEGVTFRKDFSLIKGTGEVSKNYKASLFHFFRFAYYYNNKEICESVFDSAPYSRVHNLANLSAEEFDALYQEYLLAFERTGLPEYSPLTYDTYQLYKEATAENDLGISGTTERVSSAGAPASATTSPESTELSVKKYAAAGFFGGGILGGGATALLILGGLSAVFSIATLGIGVAVGAGIGLLILGGLARIAKYSKGPEKETSGESEKEVHTLGAEAFAAKNGYERTSFWKKWEGWNKVAKSEAQPSQEVGI